MRVEHVRTVGFKGFDIDEAVPEKAIYTGKNKSGKSTRAAAIALVLYGYIPFSNVGKRPGDILDSFGGDSLIVSVTIGGKEFARKFSRNEAGKVSQTLQYEKKRCAADNFAVMLDKVGSPKIADVAEFMKQSEARKVDTLFELYPDETLSTIDSKIETAKEDVSRIEKKISGAESTVVRLTNSKNSIEMPSGTIAAVKDEIKSVDSQIADLLKQIKDAEIEEAKAQAVEQEKKEEAERKKAAKAEEIPLKTDEEWENYDLSSPSSDPKMVEADQLITRMENQSNGFSSSNDFKENDVPYKMDDGNFVNEMAWQISGGNPTESIQNIINALHGSGCSTCAALIVAKVELKKYKGDS